MKETVLITGASAGIGEATARLFAKHGYRLIITGRRIDILTALAEELKKEFGASVHSLRMDVRDLKSISDALASMPESFSNIDILINNAGLASGIDNVKEASTSDWDVMIDTNIKGLLYITRSVIPCMTERKKGHIINISSIAGKDVYPGGSVYCATKSAVDALSKGMRIDLIKHGIRVTNISPGAVETEFSLVRFHQDTERAKNVYKGYQPLCAEDIAEAILFAANRPPNVNVTELTITPVAQANPLFVHKEE